MADWKMPLSYNYNPAYHAYAYGLMYQTGPEQNNASMASWVDGAYNSSITGPYYTNPGSQQECHTQTRSPEQTVAKNNDHFQGSSVVYFGESHKQNGRIFLSHNWVPCDAKNENGSSDAPSDSEAHTSPDSWSSREGDTRHDKPVNGVLKDPDDETDGETLEGSHVSSSHLEELSTGVVCNENVTVALKKTSTGTTKAKARTAFSESQMNTLTQRFSMQRYLTPIEMKTLAGLTGLTYKQVKTWFQNRRMKLRRHQKDDHWVSERFPNNSKGCLSSVSPHLPTYQREAQSLHQEHYNHQMRESSLRQNPPQDLSYYNAGAASYPLRPSSSPRSTARSQATSWHLPPPVNHYECNPNSNTFSTASVVGNPSSIDGNSFHSPIRVTTMHTGNQ